MRRRLVGDPEGSVTDGELGDHGLVFVGATNPIVLYGSESGFVELDSGATAPHRQLRQDARLLVVTAMTLTIGHGSTLHVALSPAGGQLGRLLPFAQSDSASLPRRFASRRCRRGASWREESADVEEALGDVEMRVHIDITAVANPADPRHEGR